MDETTKTLGVLIEQGRWVASEISELRKDVKDLRDFKWKVIGFASFAAFAATLIIEFVRH